MSSTGVTATTSGSEGGTTTTVGGVGSWAMGAAGCCAMGAWRILSRMVLAIAAIW
ncbi:hypothetical protein D3C72_2085990 [compost metagenome]